MTDIAAGRDMLLEELFDYEPGWEKAILDGREKHIRQSLLESYSTPSFREDLKQKIARHEYRIMPPHEAKVPKDDGTMRTVYANEARDRILMTAVNDALFRLCPDMIHPACKSYQSGIGCGKVARQVSADLQALQGCMDPGQPIGYKVDLTKYFDSVALKDIDHTFDQVRERLGPSAVLDMTVEYYHDDVLLDMRRKKIHKFTSLRQGCAVAAFLADAALKPVDDAMASSGMPYYRYSDDILMLGPEAGKAFLELSAMLSDMSLSLNPKKVEPIYADQWFTFLGFSLKGGMITLSRKRVKNFQKAIEDRTFRHPSGNRNSGSAMARIAGYLYDGSLTGYGYAEGILPVVNARADLLQMDLFIMDCLRACDTGKIRLGGLGWDRFGRDGVIRRGRGRNVRENRDKIPHIEHYVPMSHMQAAWLHSRPAYGAYALSMRTAR